MLLQLRVIVPPDRTEAVRELFEQSPGTPHLAVLVPTMSRVIRPRG